MWFHLTHVTEEFHRVRPKWFLRLWYVQRKNSTYLASRLVLCSNGAKRASTRATSPGVPSGASKMIFEPMECKPCTYVATTLTCLQTDQNKIPHDPRHLAVPSYAPKMISKPRYIQCKLCTNLTSRLALSPTGPKWASTWASLPRINIACVQNYSWAYGMFSANHAPIMHRH
jgi:hypothetical protein